MKLAIMQPYLFPYVGYFQLIKDADKWVVFDDTQFISKGWINRNRVLHPNPNKEWQYFTVPLKKHSRTCKIKDIEINQNEKWKNELLGKLTHYKIKAPFYNDAIDLVRQCLEYKEGNLTDLVVHSLKLTCDFLQIPFDYYSFSQMDIKFDNVEHAGQWALRISDAMGADEYINPPSGYSIFKENEFVEKKIELQFLQSNLTPYVQRREFFVPGLSIIDVMMWNDIDQIQNMLMDYEILAYSQLRGYEHE